MNLTPGVLSIINEDANQQSPSDGATGNYRQETARFAASIWQLGFTDGRIGAAKKPVEELVRHWQESVKETEAKSGLPASGNGEQHASAVRNIWRATQLRFESAPHEASLLFAAIELAFGLILLLGDVGLNYSLLGDAFGLALVPTMRWLLCGGIVAVAGIAMPFFDEWVFAKHPSTKKLWTTVFLIAVMAGTIIATSMARLEQQHEKAEAAKRRQALIQTAVPIEAPPAPTLAIAYGVLSLAFAVFSGYFLASGVHRLSEREKSKRANAALPAIEGLDAKTLATIPDFEAMNFPMRTVDMSAKAIVKFFGHIYDHGYDRGAAVRWTLREGESVYSHCLRVVRHRALPTKYDETEASQPATS